MSLTFHFQPKESCITMFEPKALPSRCRSFLASTMWHTVEFSRFGRAPLPACLGGFGATLQSYSLAICLSNRCLRDIDLVRSHSGNPTNLPEVLRSVKSYCRYLFELSPAGLSSIHHFGRASDRHVFCL